MQLRLLAAAGCVAAAAGCATQDQLRQTEVQTAEQRQVVQALRADTGKTESAIAELRAELRRNRDATQALEVALADARARADGARAQADAAAATSREFLSNLVAAREEQRRQLAENGATFADLGRRLAELDARLQAQQRRLEQGGTAFDQASRRLAAAEAALAETARKTAVLEAGAKTGRDADESQTRQLTVLRSQLEETRAVISSDRLLQMMRELEGVRRDAAVLRGTVEELQKGQTDAAARSRNFYLDLDARIGALKQKLELQTGQLEQQKQALDRQARQMQEQGAAQPVQAVPGNAAGGAVGGASEPATGSVAADPVADSAAAPAGPGVDDARKQ
jgi:chromosome segregation ATPase